MIVFLYAEKFIPKVILCKNVKKITIRNATSKSINQEEIRNYTYFIYRIVIQILQNHYYSNK